MGGHARAVGRKTDGPRNRQDVKVPELLAFYKNIYKKDFSTARPLHQLHAACSLQHTADPPAGPRQECGPATKGHYKELMQKFPLVRRAAACLARASRG